MLPIDTARCTTRPIAADSRLESAAVEFEGLRARLLGVAHRILGRRAEAEDVVQDAWVRWQTTDRAAVANPTGFLVTTTTRLAINAIQSARFRHELHVHRWSPEPVAVGDDPGWAIERRAEIEAVLALLHERLSPGERAAYLLRHGFDYPYSLIAALLGTSEANARQLVSRAGRHVADDGRPAADPPACPPLTEAFASAADHGDLRTLEELLVGAA